MRLPRKPTQLLTTQLLITAEKSLNLYLIVLVLDQRFRQNSSVSLLILMLPVALEMLMYPL
jgi:hypothetical protein